jgi:hypothetical protein
LAEVPVELAVDLGLNIQREYYVNLYLDRLALRAAPREAKKFRRKLGGLKDESDVGGANPKERRLIDTFLVEWRKVPSISPEGRCSIRMKPVLLNTPRAVRHTRVICWSPEAPEEDLEPQLIVALVQFRLLPDDSPIAGRLVDYLSKFRIASKGRERESVAQAAASHILRYFASTEDFRGWRLYVSKILKRSCHEELLNSIAFPEEAEGNYLLPDSLGSEDEEAQTKQQEDSYSVTRLAMELSVSRRAVYKVIEKGRVRVLPGVPIRIARSEAETLLSSRRRRLEEQESRQRETRELEELSKSHEAARKAVYRKHGPLPRLTDSA